MPPAEIPSGAKAAASVQVYAAAPKPRRSETNKGWLEDDFTGELQDTSRKGFLCVDDAEAPKT